MRIYSDESLTNFEFWSEAKKIVDKLTSEELEDLEPIIEDMYPDGIDETELNDLFQFNTEEVLSWIGLTEDEVLDRQFYS